MTKFKTHMELPQDVIEIQRIFDENGYKLFVVGGAVRDHVMGKAPHDFDLVTDTTPDNVMRILSNYVTDLQGVKFGVVRVFTDDEPTGHEIASYRKDISKGRDNKGDDAKVEVGEHITIEDDVQRRDLTINALFYDTNTEEVIDLVGGLDDITQGIIRAVGDPIIRFNVEDRLRMLRAIRFSATTGFKIEEKTDLAIRNDNRLFGVSEKDDVSKERIFGEIVKVRKAAKSQKDPWVIKNFVDMLLNYDIFEQLFPVKVTDKPILPTLNLSVGIAQVLSTNIVTDGFKTILSEAKIPSKFIEEISILINLYQNGVDSSDVYEMSRSHKSKFISRKLLADWVDVMEITDKNTLMFLKYEPTTSAALVMVKGFKGAAIGNEIRRIEKEKFEKMLSEQVV